ncbi:MAG: tetratricopeptide repeat protein [Anaerolineaceae bacterium]
MSRKRKRSNPLRVLLLLGVIGLIIYANQIIVPTIPNYFSSTPTPTRPPESYITDAQNLEKQGKLSQAITTYKQAIEVDPRNPANYLALCRLEIYTGNYADAVIQAENALLLNSQNDQAMALRGWALSFTGDYIKAEGSLKDAITINGNNAAAYAYLSEVYLDMVNVGQGTLDTSQNAIDFSKKAVELAPSSLETHRARGLILEYTGNYEDAVTEFQAAIAIDPYIADLHLFLGRNYSALLEYDKAITEYTAANALNPKDPNPETLISKVYLTNGEYAKAVQYAEAALQDNPSDPYLYGNLGLTYWKNTQYQDAVDVLKIAVQGGTTNTGQVVKGLPMDYSFAGQYYYTYGLALAKLGQCNLALQIAQAVATGMRNDDVAVYNAQDVINTCELLAKQGATDVPTATPGAFIIQATSTPGVTGTPLPPLSTATP